MTPSGTETPTPRAVGTGPSLAVRMAVPAPPEVASRAVTLSVQLRAGIQSLNASAGAAYALAADRLNGTYQDARSLLTQAQQEGMSGGELDSLRAAAEEASVVLDRAQAMGIAFTPQQIRLGELFAIRARLQQGARDRELGFGFPWLLPAGHGHEGVVFGWGTYVRGIQSRIALGKHSEVPRDEWVGLVDDTDRMVRILRRHTQAMGRADVAGMTRRTPDSTPTLWGRFKGYLPFAAVGGAGIGLVRLVTR